MFHVSMDVRAQHMPPLTPSQLFERLAGLGIVTLTREHPPVFTVAESGGVELDLAGANTKNLFLKDAKAQLFLVVALSTTKVDLKSLPKVIGSARLSFGSPELLMESLGVPPGSVSPFALLNDAAGKVSVVIDKALMDYERINCHPLVNTATTNIARHDLLRFIRAAGHEPRIAVLGRTADLG
jgi:Ala-tRNA(Pro) deacylase